VPSTDNANTARLAATRPDRVDYRSRLQLIRDQGERPTCLAFAVTSAHEDARASEENHHNEDLSEEALYWGCKTIDGNPSPGSRFESAASALRRWGQPNENVWPYDPAVDDSRPRSLPPGVLVTNEWYRRQMQPIATALEDVKAQLVASQLVLMGLTLTYGFFVPIRGRIRDPLPAEATFGGHAVVAVGFDQMDRTVTPHFIIRNSWGFSWGDDGYGYLPYGYFNRYAISCWVTTEALREAPEETVETEKSY
jgi:C1A family cysteine protease